MSFDFTNSLFGTLGDTGTQDYLAELERFLAAHPPGKVPLPTNASASTSSVSDSSSPASSIENAKEAQDMRTGDKRKPQTKEQVSLKDRRKVSGDTQMHTHNEEDEEKEDGKDEGSAKSKGKTSDRRKLQNRNAQRAFRERKEKHLKELEEHVQELEKKATDQASENTNLKELVSHLQKENERLKVYEAAFTFNFQSTTSSSPLPVSTSLNSASPSIFAGLSKTGESTTLASLSVPTPQSTSISLFGSSGSSSTKSAGDIFAGFGPSLSSSNSSSPSTAPVATPTSTTPSFNIFNLSSPGGSTGAGFGGWRESPNELASFTGIGDNDIQDLFSNSFDFLKSGASASSGSLGSDHGAKNMASSILDPEKSPLNDQGVCAILTQAEALGGKDAGFNFDVDQLCAEMKAKATCQEMARKALEASLRDDIVFSFGTK